MGANVRVADEKRDGAGELIGERTRDEDFNAPAARPAKRG